MKKRILFLLIFLCTCMFSACAEEELDESELPLSSRYIYHTLNSTEKKEYARFCNAVSNYKYTVKVGNMSQEEFEDFFLKFYCSRADSFFLRNNIQYRVNLNGTVTECIFSYDKYSGSTETIRTQIDEIADKIISDIPEGSDDAHKLKYIHDYLVSNTTYNMEAADCDNIYGALIKHKTHCQGYSKSIAYFCDKLNIPSIIVTGEAGGPHMWNMVEIDGKWYHLDATWDDPDCGKRSSAYFFLISDNTISKTHISDNYIDYPAAYSDYDFK